MGKELSKKQRRQKAKREHIRVLKTEAKQLMAQLRVVERGLEKLHKMRPGGGRSKGNSYENEIARKIVKAFGLSQKDCYRTPSSGGHRYAKKEDPGDLVLSKRARKVFPFSVECKHYRKVDLYPFWLPQKRWPKSWSVKAWLAQTCAACTKKKEQLYPLLVFRQNSKADMVAYPSVVGLLVKHKLSFQYEGEPWLLTRLVELLRYLKEKA